MPVKLVIKPISDKSEAHISEHTYHQEVVRIGRKETNEVQLSDPRRLVSGQHAEIREKGHRFMIIDMGSKNGTQLNGQKLISGKEFPLNQDDEIAIGDFLIRFLPLSVEEDQRPAEVHRTDSTAYLPDLTQAARVLLEDLNRTYWSLMDEDSGERGLKLADTLRKGLKGLDEESVHKVIALVEARFPEPEFQEEKILHGPPEERRGTPSKEQEAQRAAYDGLLKIGVRYRQDVEDLNSPEAVAQFMERIDRVLAVMFNCLANAMKGRKQFQQEFDVEATRILSWKPNPIKLAESEHEVGEYLFGRQKAESLDKMASDLEESFSDLVLHQMGMVSGYKESLKGLMQKLNPQVLESEIRASSLSLGGVKIPVYLGPLIGLIAWRRFKERYIEFTEKEVKTFENVLGPSFAKGYLSVQKKKRVS